MATIGRPSDNVEITLSKIVVVVLLLTILMVFFISYFFKQEQQIEKTGLRSIVSAFTTNVLVVRSQWLMSKKPNIVVLKSQLDFDKKVTIKRVTVNKQGWIDVEANSRVNICEDIWLLIMDRPLAFFNMPIGAVLLNQNNKINKGHYCRYTVKNGDYFEYNSANGNISKIVQTK
ncbi:MAG: hypothetical protein ACSHW0_01260 [Thalassotalea sp.]